MLPALCMACAECHSPRRGALVQPLHCRAWHGFARNAHVHVAVAICLPGVGSIVEAFAAVADQHCRSEGWGKGRGVWRIGTKRRAHSALGSSIPAHQ